MGRSTALLALMLATAGCGGAELPATRTAGPLQGCKLAEEPGVRTWECGELIALELAAGVATDAEIRQVLDEFAGGFKDATATRTDLAWSRGAERHPSVRLEGIAPNGERFVAQMVVVTDAEGSRVVQCASRDPVSPCEPVLEHLVGTR